MKIDIYFIVFVLIIGIGNPLSAQFERTAGKIVADNQPGGIIETWDLERSSILEGSFFINDNWYVGDVKLYDGRELENVPLKYNLRDDFLHILDNYNEVAGVIKLAKIATFEWFNMEEKKNKRYVNCLDYKVNDTHLTGVAEILIEGKADLLIYKELDLLKGNYSLIHDAGQKNDEYVINDHYYICIDETMHHIKNKKSLLGIFESHQEKMDQFIKANHLRAKNENDLQEIVNYYNSL